MILKMVSYEFENDYINIINVCSRTLRQFDQNQKTGKILAILNLNARGVYTSHQFIPQKKNECCNFYIFHFSFT